MLLQLAHRFATEVSWRLLWKAGRLWAYKGAKSLRAHRRRLERGEVFPPFLFLAITNACNLRCHGCWITSHGRPQSLSREDIDRIITAGKRQRCYFYSLLGGEPMLYPRWWEIPLRHADCYFQIITNGMFLSEENVGWIRRAGNVTPLVSIDGLEPNNDQRRGNGVFEAAIEGIRRLQKRKVLFGVATTITGQNVEEVLSDRYVEFFVRRGAMYLWYYVYRPVGADPSPQFAVAREQMIELRKRLLALRRKHPIVIIDTYWDADGRAVCPAASGLGFHIGPQGSIEPCPPLSFACETVRDRGGDLFETIDGSRFLRGFQRFAAERTRGCVILERPQELVEYLRSMSAGDYSGRDAYSELSGLEPRTSHHLPGEEIPEDSWLYRFLKKQLFFGMGAYG